MKDRFLGGEEGSRKEQAILELLLTYAIPQKDVQPLARKLLVDFGSLSAVLGAPYEALCQVAGIKSSSGVLLKLVDWVRTHYPTITEVKKEDQEEINSRQLLLFDRLRSEKPPEFRGKTDEEKPVRKNLARRGTEMFVKAVLKEAIQILPSLPDSESLDEVRSFLRSRLHFNAEQTRHRYANYITRRMFPEGYADGPLRSFAKAFPNSAELRDVCFYRFLQSEPLLVDILEDLILPSLGTGRLGRERIREHLSEKFPEARSIIDCGKAIVDALTAASIVKADRTKINFAYREIPLASFAFVLHSEFPEPGMYDIRKLDENRMIRAMLWNPERLLHALYEVRNRGLISKISEIDNIRQFTTKHTLAGVVEHIVLGREKP